VDELTFLLPRVLVCLLTFFFFFFFFFCCCCCSWRSLPPLPLSQLACALPVS